MRRIPIPTLLAMLCVILAGTWYFQPERRLRRSWHKLIEVVEARHARALGSLLAEDYGDRWSYTRTTIVADARLAFHHFESLTIRVDEAQFRLDGDRATITAMLRVEARGTQQAADARVAANALFSPFVFEWKRAAGFPWEWELVRFDQPEFDLNRYRRGLPPGY